MKNSKIIVLFFLSSIYQSISFAQGVFFELNSGYSLSTSSQNLGSNSSSTEGINNYSFNEKNVVGSFGKGLNVGFKIGYQFSQNIAFDVQTEYLFGAEFTDQSTHLFSYPTAGMTYSESYSFTSDHRAGMLRINPAIVFEVPKNKFIPYARLGVLVGMGTINESFKYFEEVVYPDWFGGSQTSTSSWEVTTRLRGGLSIGASAEMGLRVAVSERFSIIGALKLNSMSYAPTRGSITSYTWDGTDFLSELTTSERETEFVNEINNSNTSDLDPNKPDKALKTHYAFSGLGLHVGIRFSL